MHALWLVALLVIPSCTYFTTAKAARDVAVKTAVTEYCQLPQSVREANRNRFKISPDKPPFIQVFCENL